MSDNCSCRDENPNHVRLLDEVDWPTASTILHFAGAREYPILDFERCGRWVATGHRGTRWDSGFRI